MYLDITTEFNSRNYRETFIDDRIRKEMGIRYPHFCGDASLVLATIDFNRYMGIDWPPIFRWCEKNRMTFYRPILEELFKTLKFHPDLVKEECGRRRMSSQPVSMKEMELYYGQFRRMLRILLDRPNVRLVLPPDAKRRKLVKFADFSKLGISTEDAYLLEIASEENGCVVTCDKKISEVGYNRGVVAKSILVDGLPQKISGDWTELKRESQSRQKI